MHIYICICIWMCNVGNRAKRMYQASSTAMTIAARLRATSTCIRVHPGFRLFQRLYSKTYCLTRQDYRDDQSRNSRPWAMMTRGWCISSGFCGLKGCNENDRIYYCRGSLNGYANSFCTVRFVFLLSRRSNKILNEQLCGISWEMYFMNMYKNCKHFRLLLYSHKIFAPSLLLL